MKNLSELEALLQDAELYVIAESLSKANYRIPATWTETDAKFHVDNFNDLMPNTLVVSVFNSIRKDIPLALIDSSPYVRYVAQHYASRMME